jgi:hypothetical protein
MPKKKVLQDDMPKCEHCVSGVFDPGEEVGECRFLPMTFVSVASEEEPLACWAPAIKGESCRQFLRKVH